MTGGIGEGPPAPVWLPGGHLQTIVPSAWPAAGPPGATEPLEVRVDASSRVRVELDRTAGARGTLLLVHGLGGSSDSPYVRRAARRALERGYAVARMNLRNCGGTERLATTLYNAGQEGDVGAVLAALDEAGMPRPHVAAGFSLGAGLALLHAGRSGSSCAADAVAAINPPVDLGACLDALERPVNALYETRFVLLLCGQIRRARRVRPVPGPAASPIRIRRLRRFDDLFTAVDAGYDSSEAYYRGASAGPWLPAIARPTLVVSATNDPFVLVDVLRRYRGASPRIRWEHPRAGGHCGYWGRGAPRAWIADAVLDWVETSL